MKITHTEIFRFSIRMEPFAISAGTMHFAQNVFIRIHTDEGMYGVGECSAFPVIVGETQETCLVMARDFAGLWKGKDPLDIPARMQELHDYCAGNSTIKSAFDMALYDLSAKSAGQPLYRFLGGSRRRLETDITIGIATPEKMAARALQFQEQGAKIMKVKVGKKVKDDLERIRQIRKAVKADMIIRIDVNQGWDFDEAVYALHELEDLGMEFCEQPMRTWYDDQLPELRRQTSVKIMADESCYHHHDARKLITAGACDSINIKLSKSGGILEALKIHDTASAAGVDCMIGGMLESRIALSAKAHFACAGANIRYIDLDTCLLGHLEDPVTGGAVYQGYVLDVPETPGIGADADETFLKTCDKWRI